MRNIEMIGHVDDIQQAGSRRSKPSKGRRQVTRSRQELEEAATTPSGIAGERSTAEAVLGDNISARRKVPPSGTRPEGA